jgi:hypothetical protein
MIGPDEKRSGEGAERSQDSEDAHEADRAHKAALKREERLDRRLNESSTLFTRADVLVVIVSLVLAAAVAAMSWFGAGFNAGGKAETEASGDAGAVSVASSSDGSGSEDGVAQVAQSAGQDPDESQELDEGQGSTVQDKANAGSSSDADSTGAGEGLYAVVQNTEGFYQVLPLWEDAEVRVESSFGYNVVEVSEGRVRVSEADCKNQICVNTGWSSSEGQIITCLPHQLVVEIVSDPADASSLG